MQIFLTNTEEKLAPQLQDILLLHFYMIFYRNVVKWVYAGSIVPICMFHIRNYPTYSDETLFWGKVPQVEYKGFLRWCVILRITEFLDFVHRPEL
jgi:hypothetical protein